VAIDKSTITAGNLLSMATTVLAAGGALIAVTVYIGDIRAEMRIADARHDQRLEVLEKEQAAAVAQNKVDREILWEIRGDIKQLKSLFDRAK
jgi:hypothetical protein